MALGKTANRALFGVSPCSIQMSYQLTLTIAVYIWYLYLHLQS